MNVFVLIVVLLIGSLNVAVTSESSGRTSGAPSPGFVVTTFGGYFTSPFDVAAVAAAAVAFSAADSAPLIPK